MTHCSEHLIDLFEDGEYEKAIDTRFVTTTNSYSMQMILIFFGVFGLLGVSVGLMCMFMRNKKNRSSTPTADLANPDTDFTRSRRNRYESDEESSDYVKKYRRPNARASRDTKDSGSGSDHRHFGGESDRQSNINVPLLDCSDGTMSADGRGYR